MKKNSRKFIFTVLRWAGAALLLLIAAGLFTPLGENIFCILFGNAYRKVGETVLKGPVRSRTLAIYKADGKPFLLVGPCKFYYAGELHEGYEDFFFVNSQQVILTATDKGGDLWVRLGNRLYVIDDLSNYWEQLRAPCWSALECGESIAIQRNPSGDVESYHFSIRMNSPEIPGTFTIPGKFFTPDMDTAPNVTWRP